MALNASNVELGGSGVPIPRWRWRPDGRQRWHRLDISPALASRLRRRAREAGVTVDAWLGIALAVQRVRAELDEDLPSNLRRAVEIRPVTPAANRRVESWQRYLTRRDGPGIRDELPEVLLDGAARAEEASALEAALSLSDAEWELGRECEIRAAGSGNPLPDYIRAVAAGA